MYQEALGSDLQVRALLDALQVLIWISSGADLLNGGSISNGINGTLWAAHSEEGICDNGPEMRLTAFRKLRLQVGSKYCQINIHGKPRGGLWTSWGSNFSLLLSIASRECQPFRPCPFHVKLLAFPFIYATCLTNTMVKKKLCISQAPRTYPWEQGYESHFGAYLQLLDKGVHSYPCRPYAGAKWNGGDLAVCVNLYLVLLYRLHFAVEDQLYASSAS